MRICPNCHMEASDEQAFCGKCGTKLETEVPVEELVAETEETTAVAPVEETTQKKPVLADLAEQAKALALKVKAFALKTTATLLAMPRKKLLTIGGIALGALVVVIVLIALLAGGGKPNYQMFIKDDQICYIDLNGGKTIELTTNLIDGAEITDGQLASSAHGLGSYISVNKNRDRIFYPDRVGNSSGMTLYTRSLKKPEEAPVKLDSGVTQYFINEKGTRVVYLKKDGDTGTLYIHNLEEKTKLVSDVKSFRMDEKFEKILYMNGEKNVYIMTLGKDNAEKVASNIDSLSYSSKDLKTLFYTKEGALYLQKVGEEDRTKVDEEIYRTVKIYDSGKVYYIKKTDTEEPLMSYVEDDLAASDAAMQQPELVYPDRPTAPKYPYRSDYDTTEEYDAAKAQYDIDYKAYQDALTKYNDDCNKIRDKYYKDRDLYYEKQDRDNMRENLKDSTFTITKYSLHYFDGKESKVITEELHGSYNYDVCYDKEMLVAEMVEASTLPKFKISELEYASQVRDKLREALDSRTKETYLVVGSERNLLDATTDYLIFAPNGSAIYYLEDVETDDEGEKSKGTLYEIVINKGKPEAPKVYDEDVSTRQVRFLDKDLVYYKNTSSDDSGDLYINGEEVDYDVYLYNLVKFDGGVLYFTDWDEEHDCGTLKLFKKGEKIKVADDVHDCIVAENDELLYLYDYSTKYYTGTMYRYNNGKPEKLEDDVMALMSHNQK